MNFLEARRLLGRMLASHGIVVSPGSGIFVGALNQEINVWISVPGNNYMIMPAMGVALPKVNEIAIRTAKLIWPNQRWSGGAGSVLPILRQPLQNVISARIVGGGAPPWLRGKLDVEIIEGVAQFIVGATETLSEKYNAEMEVIAECLVAEKYSHSSQLIIPAYFLKKGRREEIISYAREYKILSERKLAELDERSRTILERTAEQYKGYIDAILME